MNLTTFNNDQELNTFKLYLYEFYMLSNVFTTKIKEQEQQLKNNIIINPLFNTPERIADFEKEIDKTIETTANYLNRLQSYKTVILNLVKNTYNKYNK